LAFFFDITESCCVGIGGRRNK
jgi:hypothetical protein